MLALSAVDTTLVYPSVTFSAGGKSAAWAAAAAAAADGDEAGGAGVCAETNTDDPAVNNNA